jgi:superfamily II DNA or RNA helicase
MKLLNLKPTVMTVMAAAKKSNDNPLLSTPFGRAFLRFDGMDPEKHFCASYAALAMGVAGFRNYVVKTIYGSDMNIRPGSLSMDSTDQAYESTFDDAGKMIGAARVRRKGNRIAISIPVGTFGMGSLFYPETRWAAAPPLAQNRATINAFVSRIQRSKFKNMLTTDKGLDVSIGAEDVLAQTPAEDYTERTTGRRETAYPRLFAQVFTKFRFLRPPLEEVLSSETKQRGIGAMVGGRIPFDELSVEHPVFQENDQLAAQALNLFMSTPIAGFVECELDDEFVTSLTGQSAATVPLSLIGNWLNGTIEFQWFAPDDSIGDAAQVSSLGRSKAQSVASKARPYDPAENAERICIDNEAYFYYLPATDNVEQYEAELESTFTDAAGEWSSIDVMNPKNVIRFDAGNGRMRTMPRKLQANRVIFTDFQAGILAYTDDRGLLKTYDIGTFRNVDAAHIVEMLNLPLGKTNFDNEAFLGMLNSAIAASGARRGETDLPHQEGDNVNLNLDKRTVMNQRLVEFFEGRRYASFVGYVADLQRTYLSWREDLSEEFLDEVRELQFRHLSPSSPVPELRLIYRLLKAHVDHLIDNFETEASNYTLLPTLKRIGLLSSIVNNAPKFATLDAADREEREAFTSVPTDYRDVTLPEIPFTKGVKLMPHQVKMFAALALFPKRFTLDVSAGGGKTFTAVLIAAMYMMHAGVKKPIVICPAILLKNYFEDAAYATSGAMNIIAVSTDTLNRWGVEKLAELIANAPINTIVVAAVESMSRGQNRVYGTRKINVNPTTEFLQQFDFDMCIIDESHRVKNVRSYANRNVSRITARSTYNGIMTGTLIFNGSQDVVGQFALIDPTIFGSPSYFDEKYMEAEGGVKRAKTDTPRAVKDRMREHTRYIQITRKEWAALLPPKVDEFTGEPTEEFHILNDPNFPDQPQMTQAQTDYYNLMLDEIRKKILKDAETDASLARLLASMERPDREGDDDGDDDEKTLEGIMNKLNPYLARLEIFIANPTNSREAEFTKRLRSAEDRTSPKAKKVVEICKHHIEKGYVGKILVFTQYNESAEGIFNSLPAELKSRAVHYTTDDKNALAQFESDPSIMILVGCERSIGTGLNLQMASRIIRCESTWNWGALEQAESRVNRPVPKSREVRKAIYLDWIVVNSTIDVTKITRMISKAVESYKFVNAGNPAFDDMDALPATKMSLENILLRNDVNTTCAEHFHVFQLCRVLEEQEFQEFRRDPNIRTEPYELQGSILPGSKLLKNVPYVPGMALFGKKELGLVPFIEYVTQTSHSTLAQFNPLDHTIHTEYGDGRCVGVSRKKTGELSSVTVDLPDGSKGTFDLSAVFVVTKPSVGLDTRRDLAQQVMMTHLGVPVKLEPSQAPVQTTPLAVEPDAGRTAPQKLKLLRTQPVPNADIVHNGQFALYVTSVGHMYNLAASLDDGEDVPEEMLMQEGFHRVKPYYYAEFKGPKQLQEWYDKARKVSGMAEESKQQIEEIIALMAKHTADSFFRNVNAGQLRNFWRSQQKPAKAGMITPFISIEDNGAGKKPKVYMVAFKHQNPQFRNVTARAKVSNLMWHTTDSDQLWFTAPKQRDIIAKLKEVYAKAPNLSTYKMLLHKITMLRPVSAVNAPK